VNIQLQLRTMQQAQNLNLRNRFTDSVQSFHVEKVGSNFKNILIQTAYIHEY